MEPHPNGEAQKFVSSTGLRAEELLTAIGKIPVQPVKRVESEPQPEKRSDSKYIAEVGLMKKSLDYYLRNNIPSELTPGLDPDEPTIEAGLRASYEEGRGLDAHQILFAHVLIESGRERAREKLLAERSDSLTEGQIKHLKRAKAYFRTELRNVIESSFENSETGILQEDMAAWLGHFSGDADWASKLVIPEVAATIATHDYLDGRGGVHVEYPSPEETAAYGNDLNVIQYHEASGEPLKVKTKPVAASEGDVRMRHGGMVELQIPKSQIENFKFKSPDDGNDLVELMNNARSGARVAYTSESRNG